LRSVGPEPAKKFLVFYVTRRFLYSVHKVPSLVAVLSQMIPVHALCPFFFKVHFNIIIPATIVVASGIFILEFFNQTLCAFYAPMLAAFAAHITALLALVILVIWNGE